VARQVPARDEQGADQQGAGQSRAEDRRPGLGLAGQRQLPRQIDRVVVPGQHDTTDKDAEPAAALLGGEGQRQD
jgi:hypothetical protein